MSSFDQQGFDPMSAWAEAIENGDYQLAEELQAGLTQGIMDGAREAYELGQVAGRAEVSASQLSPEAKAAADKRYADFLESEAPEPEKSAERKAADDILRVAKEANYENTALAALKQIDKRFAREYGATD